MSTVTSPRDLRHGARRGGRRATAVVGVLVLAAGVAPAIGSPVAAAAESGMQLWVARYSSAGGVSTDSGKAVAVSRNGQRVYVAAAIGNGYAPYQADFLTVAFNAATGARLWAKPYSAAHRDVPASIAVGPYGSRVFVTGTSGPDPGGIGVSTFTTIAYSASTGARLWVRRYRVDARHSCSARQLAVAPNGATVFVTGVGAGRTNDYVTVAYNAATGAQRWVARYNGPGNRYDEATAIGVDPAGRRVYVTGTSKGVTSGQDYATVAYNAATGARLWVKRYNGTGNGYDAARSLVVGPGGRRVFVTGQSLGTTSKGDYVTIAYSSATGAQLWARRYNGPGNGADIAQSIAVSPTGSRVFVTGTSGGVVTTVAYGTGTGARLWATQTQGVGAPYPAPPACNAPVIPVPECPRSAPSVAVNPSGGKLYVIGTSSGSNGQLTTVAYNATTGTQMWLARFVGATDEFGHGDPAGALAVGPDGDRVYVTGADITGNEGDYPYSNAVTLAYQN